MLQTYLCCRGCMMREPRAPNDPRCQRTLRFERTFRQRFAFERIKAHGKLGVTGIDHVPRSWKQSHNLDVEHVSNRKPNCREKLLQLRRLLYVADGAHDARTVLVTRRL
jgi:hypothetical protein